jgi:hypothetical protein
MWEQLLSLTVECGNGDVKKGDYNVCLLAYSLPHNHHHTGIKISSKVNLKANNKIELS